MNSREQNLRGILRDQFLEAIQAAQSGKQGIVDFSNQFHNTITETLYEFVYTDSTEKPQPTTIDIVYGDGSYGRPFPVRCLRKRHSAQSAPVRRLQPLRAALISMRHLEMDALVDMAWLLNKDVPTQHSLEAVDEYSYQQTCLQLQDGLREGAFKLHLYQTGFQPAVVGFYRALVEELLQRNNQPSVLEVTPYYFSRLMGCYGRGEVWN